MSRKAQRRANNSTPRDRTEMVLARFEALFRRGTELLQRGRAQDAVHPLTWPINSSLIILMPPTI
ncbi:MAG: hypothetical protein IPL78_05945 [Chloroflexi bacterium]|nr:hypothetical protein [Chloroflexota bacterium]